MKISSLIRSDRSLELGKWLETSVGAIHEATLVLDVPSRSRASRQDIAPTDVSYINSATPG